MPKVAGSVKELLAAIDGIARIDGERLVVVDEDGLRTRGIYDLVWTATFSEDEATVQRRLHNARREIEHYGLFDYLVVNDDLDQAVRQIIDHITSWEAEVHAR